MSHENVEIVRRAEAAINRRDLEELKLLMAPDCQVVPLSAAVDSTLYRGADVVATWFAALDESWESNTAEAETFRDGPDWVLTLGRIRARGRTSGASLDVSAAAIWRVRDGLITSVRIYTDRDRALADLGLAAGAGEADSP
jgi:ketosteroid isomerase-like protein